MNNKLLEAQRNIDKIRKSSAIPDCGISEQETQEMFQKLLIELNEAKKELESDK